MKVKYFFLLLLGVTYNYTAEHKSFRTPHPPTVSPSPVQPVTSRHSSRKILPPQKTPPSLQDFLSFCIDLARLIVQNLPQAFRPENFRKYLDNNLAEEREKLYAERAHELYSSSKNTHAYTTKEQFLPLIEQHIANLLLLTRPTNVQLLEIGKHIKVLPQNITWKDIHKSLTENLRISVDTYSLNSTEKQALTHKVKMLLNNHPGTQ